jgi:PIN domain nuclease of toxin-antitoxin system
MTNSPCIVSVASVWEIDLKHRLGKLPIAPQRFRDEMQSAGAVILSITDEHVLTLVKQADSHCDPFDRLLLSVAEAEHLILLTADEALIGLGRRNPRLPVRAA